jgi:hypothetical protein
VSMEKAIETPQGVTITKLAVLLRRLGLFKNAVNDVKAAGMFEKAKKAEIALDSASALLGDLTSLVHEYNAKIGRIEDRMEYLEKCHDKLAREVL